MKLKIITGTIIIALLMLLVPSISAVEYKTVVDTNKSNLLNEIKSIDIDALEKTLKSINNPSLQEKIQNIDFSALKQKISSLQTGVIDFANIYLLMLSILMTVLVGKPTITRFLFNAITINSIIYGLRTGELVGRCPKFYAGLIAYPILVLGALMYSSTQSMVVVVLSNILYLIVLLFLTNIIEASGTVTPTT